MATGFSRRELFEHDKETIRWLLQYLTAQLKLQKTRDARAQGTLAKQDVPPPSKLRTNRYRFWRFAVRGLIRANQSGKMDTLCEEDIIRLIEHNYYYDHFQEPLATLEEVLQAGLGDQKALKVLTGAPPEDFEEKLLTKAGEPLADSGVDVEPKELFKNLRKKDESSSREKT